MNNKQWTLFSLLFIYALIVGSLTVYHAHHFSDYVHRKGDESLDYVLFLLFSSLLFQGVVWGIGGKLFLKPLLLATLVNVIVSFFLGLGILLLSGLSGIPSHCIFIYGASYQTIFVLVTSWQIKSKTE